MSSRTCGASIRPLFNSLGEFLVVRAAIHVPPDCSSALCRVAGSSIASASATYGVINQFAPANWPGSRCYSSFSLDPVRLSVTVSCCVRSLSEAPCCRTIVPTSSVERTTVRVHAVLLGALPCAFEPSTALVSLCAADLWEYSFSQKMWRWLAGTSTATQGTAYPPAGSPVHVCAFASRRARLTRPALPLVLCSSCHTTQAIRSPLQ